MNKQNNSSSSKKKIVLHFETDSTGNILNPDVVEQLKELAITSSKNADRIVINAYSEQTGSEENNYEVALSMAKAAKKAMSIREAPRVYYDVGIDVKGYQNPINKNDPSDLINRRVEITDLK
jgi:outer membrane protein OmpA-like peptidoglycan-associated protein